jgi:hypothetical protein
VDEEVSFSDYTNSGFDPVPKLDSCRLPIVVIQHSTESAAGLHSPRLYTCISGDDELICMSGRALAR